MIGILPYVIRRAEQPELKPVKIPDNMDLSMRRATTQPWRFFYEPPERIPESPIEIDPIFTDWIKDAPAWAEHFNIDETGQSTYLGDGLTKCLSYLESFRAKGRFYRFPIPRRPGPGVYGLIGQNSKLYQDNPRVKREKDPSCMSEKAPTLSDIGLDNSIWEIIGPKFIRICVDSDGYVYGYTGETMIDEYFKNHVKANLDVHFSFIKELHNTPKNLNLDWKKCIWEREKESPAVPMKTPALSDLGIDDSIWAGIPHNFIRICVDSDGYIYAYSGKSKINRLNGDHNPWDDSVVTRYVTDLGFTPESINIDWKNCIFDRT